MPDLIPTRWLNAIIGVKGTTAVEGWPIGWLMEKLSKVRHTQSILRFVANVTLHALAFYPDLRLSIHANTRSAPCSPSQASAIPLRCSQSQGKAPSITSTTPFTVSSRPSEPVPRRLQPPPPQQPRPSSRARYRSHRRCLACRSRPHPPTPSNASSPSKGKDKDKDKDGAPSTFLATLKFRGAVMVTAVEKQPAFKEAMRK
ncbi:hypothetical protein M422DRAFT_251588 [Sphaerobolus stellatus SS14]|uniref:Uncharacterized protein n=1 Tax=Sphaerobolus stellatus (strain SS14) TaxID=990650 RepID=A0A0C9W1Y5_SPHS4|nr:hypothetical protein M422DRAFT_251588 [Sphaerobolus stellatus SS14]